MSVGALIAEFNEQEKDAIVAQFLPLIKYTAHRMAWNLPPELTVDDLISAGMVGLMDAMGRFEHGRVKLKTFARKRIKGAMLDEIRSAEPISRSAKKKLRRLRQVHDELQQRLGRPAESSEAARHMGISLGEYYGVLNNTGTLMHYRVDDWDAGGGNGEGLSLIDCIADSYAPDPIDALEYESKSRELLRGVYRLPRRERLLVFLYYWESLTMKQIGEILGLTESRVCQLHRECIQRLRAGLDTGL